jgi:hypothetical protein
MAGAVIRGFSCYGVAMQDPTPVLARPVIPSRPKPSGRWVDACLWVVGALLLVGIAGAVGLAAVLL